MIYYEGDLLELHRGDCVDVMALMDEATVDSIVCDPPYGLEFMGKDFDKLGEGPAMQQWHHAWAIEALRVLKPGGHLLAFGGTRTVHRLTCALEDAGFEIRDSCIWIYGSGFPKSLDASKAIDKAAGAEREVVGEGERGPHAAGDFGMKNRCPKCGKPKFSGNPCVCPEPAAITPEAKQWEGWGTALKPAHEPIVMARKPLIGTVAANVLAHGTGALNIDASRIWIEETLPHYTVGAHQGKGAGLNPYFTRENQAERAANGENPRYDNKGRWPANVLHDGSPEVVALFPQTTTGDMKRGAIRATSAFNPNTQDSMEWKGDSGSAARFFFSPEPDAKRYLYVPKAGREERLVYLTCDCETVNLASWVHVVQNQDEATAVTSPPRDISEDTWAEGLGSSTGTSGKKQTAPSPTATASTTSTETSKTTDSKTSNLSPLPSTNGFTEDVKSEVVDGGSRVESAAFSNLSKQSGICHLKDGRCMGVVVPVTSPLLSKPSVCVDCGNELRRNGHPTQKPVGLMRYLVRLVTPPGGTVLDPFMGSGSTGKAVMQENLGLLAQGKEPLKFIGIEQDAEYLEIAKRRIASVPTSLFQR